MVGELYNYNGCVIKDNGNDIYIKTPLNTVYNFSTKCGKYCYVFPNPFLNKYKVLYYNKASWEDILMSMVCSTIPYSEEEEDYGCIEEYD